MSHLDPILKGPTFGDPGDVPPPSVVLVEHLRQAFAWKKPELGPLVQGLDRSIAISEAIARQEGRDEVVNYLFNILQQSMEN